MTEVRMTNGPAINENEFLSSLEKAFPPAPPPTADDALITTIRGTVQKVSADSFAALEEFQVAKDKLQSLLEDDLANITRGLEHYLLIAKYTRDEAKRLTEAVGEWASDHARLVNAREPK